MLAGIKYTVPVIRRETGKTSASTMAGRPQIEGEAVGQGDTVEQGEAIIPGKQHRATIDD